MTYVATITTTIEAAPLTATPSNLPPMPTGQFALPATESPGCSNACVRGLEDLTWGCGISSKSGTFENLQINVMKDGGMIQLSTITDNAGPLTYGAQTPVFKSPEKPRLVLDNDDKSKGPAYY